MLNFLTRTPEDTLSLGKALGECLVSGDVVLLNGDLGAGKSVLARGLARGVGIDCAMPSPTFTLMQPYEGRISFYHFDLYRLDEPDQFYEAGLEEYAFGNGAAVIEWPECAELEPDMCLNVTIARGQAEEERHITVMCVGLDAGREEALAAAGAKWRMDE